MSKRSLFLLAVSTASIVAAWPVRAQQAPTATPAPTPTPAQTAEPVPPEDEVDVEVGSEVVVTGERERGSVPGDVKPEQVLRPADIRGYGATSISDLVSQLGPQLGSGRGAEGGMPVVLLNGRRISGFREIRNYPPEAIERIDILPPEAAQQLGYRAEQRVINFVLRRRFNAVTAEVKGGGATQGDRYTTDDEASLLRIMRERRLNVALNYNAQTPVYESDRSIIPTPPSQPYAIVGNVTPGFGLTQVDPALSALAGSTVTVAGVPTGVTGRPTLGSFGAANPSSFAPYRTLSPSQQKFESTLSYATRLFDTIDASFTGGFDWSKGSSALGLATASLTIPNGSPFSPFSNPVVLNRYLVEGGARTQDNATTSGEFGMALNGDIGRWRWSFNGNYTRAFSSTLTDNSFDLTGIAGRIAAGDPTLNPFAFYPVAALGDFRRDYARSLTSTATAETQVNGPLFALPAGDARLNVKTGFATSDLATRTIRSGVTTLGDLSRNVGSGQARIDLPIANRGRGVLSPIGQLSVNASYAYEQQSNFGWLSTYGYGLNWSPLPGKIFFLASFLRDENAPSIGQLGNPVIVTPNARVFDFVTGTSVDVTSISGGNPNLLGPERRVTNLLLNARPFSKLDLNINAEYTRTRITNPIETLGTPTAALEAAFPNSFQRDASGQLTRVDFRPVNFARADTEQLRTTINFSRRIGPAAPAGGGFRGMFGGAGGANRTPEERAQRRAERATPEAQVGTRGPEQRGQATPPPAPTGAPTTVVVQNDGPPPPAGGGRRFGGPGGGFGGRGGFGGGGFSNEGRLQLTLSHTWKFRDTLTVGPGIPDIDRLHGDATDPVRGPREHQIDFSTGITKGPYGIRADGQWRSGTFVRGGSTRNPTDVTVDPLTTVRLRGWVSFNPTMKVARDHPWLIGTRVQLEVANLFDTRPQVRDALGTVPINYQPDLIDPIGRTVSLSLRKLFFSRPVQRGGALRGAAN